MYGSIFMKNILMHINLYQFAETHFYVMESIFPNQNSPTSWVIFQLDILCFKPVKITMIIEYLNIITFDR